MITAGQAAKRAGVSKTTISTSLKSGRLSYVEKVGNQYRIDPAEVDRVFPPNSTRTETLNESVPPAERENYETQIRLLRELIEELKGERDHLRQLQIADQRKAPFWERMFRKSA